MGNINQIVADTTRMRAANRADMMRARFGNHKGRTLAAKFLRQSQYMGHPALIQYWQSVVIYANAS